MAQVVVPVSHNFLKVLIKLLGLDVLSRTQPLAEKSVKPPICQVVRIVAEPYALLFGDEDELVTHLVLSAYTLDIVDKTLSIVVCI